MVIWWTNTVFFFLLEIETSILETIVAFQSIHGGKIDNIINYNEPWL